MFTLKKIIFSTLLIFLPILCKSQDMVFNYISSNKEMKDLYYINSGFHRVADNDIANKYYDVFFTFDEFSIDYKNYEIITNIEYIQKDNICYFVFKTSNEWIVLLTIENRFLKTITIIINEGNEHTLTKLGS